MLNIFLIFPITMKLKKHAYLDIIFYSHNIIQPIILLYLRLCQSVSSIWCKKVHVVISVILAHTNILQPHSVSLSSTTTLTSQKINDFKWTKEDDKVLFLFTLLLVSIVSLTTELIQLLLVARVEPAAAAFEFVSNEERIVLRR